MLKVGVFGVGHLGKYHLNNWKEIPEVSLVGFFDPNNDNAKEVEKTYGLKRFMDEEALIAACDIIDIVTPTQHHFPVCEMAIKMGKNVFVEKPMANTIEEGKAIVNMVKEANVKLQVGHVERFNPAYTALKNASLNPLFIEVHRLAQFNPRGTEVSVIFDLMIHDIDIILSIVKSDIKNISASGVAVLTDTPDIANVRIEFNNGCVANLTSSRISMKKMRKIRLFQKDAYIGIDFLEKNTEIIKLKKPEDPETFSFDIETHQGTKTISIENPVIEDGNAIKAELSSFVHSILNNETPVVSEIDGFLAMEVAHQILEKINKSSPTLKDSTDTNEPMPLED
jgi:predicted dehydrogenase